MSDPEDGPGSHYTNPLFRKELKKVIDFELKCSLGRNYRVFTTSETDTIDNPLSRCIDVYLEALEYGLRFPLPKIMMEILQYTILQLPNLFPMRGRPFYRSLPLVSLKILSAPPRPSLTCTSSSVTSRRLGERLVSNSLSTWVHVCFRQAFFCS